MKGHRSWSLQVETHPTSQSTPRSGRRDPSNPYAFPQVLTATPDCQQMLHIVGKVASRELAKLWFLSTWEGGFEYIFKTTILRW